nr:response regulator [Trichocoleus sp. FACHB-90]
MPRRQTASPPAQKAPASVATQKILIIDDAKVIRSQIPEMLPQGKFEVLEAKDGQEGLNLIRQESPNLILLDWIMPRLGGWEVFQQLQSQPELQTIPLVVMSGRKEEVKEKLSEPFEYFEFLEKPFNNKQLTDAIKSAMAKARRVRPSVGTASFQTAVVADSTGAGVQLQALNEKIATMQAEINGLKQQVAEIPGLKKQLAQLMAFVKQKLH